MAKVGAGYSRAVSTDEAQLFSKDGADGWTGWLFQGWPTLACSRDFVPERGRIHRHVHETS